MSYTLEYAKSDRSSCSGPKNACPSKDHGIAKGELRLGVEVLNIHGIKWRHWYCTTPKVIENMKSDFNSARDIPGFEDLRPDDQEKVERAWEEGEIPEDERPEPAKEHTANKRKHVDFSASNEGNTSAENGEAEDDQDKKEPTKSTTKKTQEKQGKEPASKKQKVVPSEPKVASFATKNKKVDLREKKSRGEPTRRSTRITALKKEDIKEEDNKEEENALNSPKKRVATKSDSSTSKKAKKN